MLIQHNIVCKRNTLPTKLAEEKWKSFIKLGAGLWRGLWKPIFSINGSSYQTKKKAEIQKQGTSTLAWVERRWMWNKKFANPRWVYSDKFFGKFDLGESYNSHLGPWQTFVTIIRIMVYRLYQRIWKSHSSGPESYQHVVFAQKRSVFIL